MDGVDSVAGYTEVRELGSGASGRVVHAVHDATGTPVAIKYLAAGLVGDDAWRTRFRDEARLLAQLRDQNLVWFYEYAESTGGAAIVMELVDGVTLRAILDRDGAVPPEAAIAVLKGSLLGLAAAHRVGVVHRDYKPANVLVDGRGWSKLADFGIAVPAGSATEAAGSPAYLPPEQWAGAAPQAAGDVYSATAVFFECLTGRRPFPLREAAMLAQAHMYQQVSLSDVPEPMRELVAAGLAKQPEHRPPSADEFVRRLEIDARRAYGDDWESRGRKRLAGLAALWAASFPLAAAYGGGGGVAGTASPQPPAATAAGPPDGAAAPVPTAGGGGGPKPWWVKAGAAAAGAAAATATVLVVVNNTDDDPPPAAQQPSSAAPAPPTRDPLAGIDACDVLGRIAPGSDVEKPEVIGDDNGCGTLRPEWGPRQGGLYVALQPEPISELAADRTLSLTPTEINGRNAMLNHSPPDDESGGNCMVLMDYAGVSVAEVQVFSGGPDPENNKGDLCAEARHYAGLLESELPQVG